MKCYRCKCDVLPLSPLTEAESIAYPLLGWVMRQCASCGTHQNHCRERGPNEEPLDPFEAALHAPVIGPDGIVVPARKLWVKPNHLEIADRERRKQKAVIEMETSPVVLRMHREGSNRSGG